MDTRLIFRDYRCPIKSDAGTQTVSPGEGWCRTRMKGDGDRQIRSVRLPGKAARRAGYPYHKPTQVVEMSILRRSGDGLFRN